MDHHVGLLRRLIDILQSWHIAGAPFPGFAVNPLRVSRDTGRQRTLDVYFQETLDLLPRPLSILPAIGCGVEDYGNAVLYQEHPGISQIPIEPVARRRIIGR